MSANKDDLTTKLLRVVKALALIAAIVLFIRVTLEFTNSDILQKNPIAIGGILAGLISLFLCLAYLGADLKITHFYVDADDKKLSVNEPDRKDRSKEARRDSQNYQNGWD